MNYNLLIGCLCSLATLFSHELLAQQPESVQMKPTISSRRLAPQACLDQSAGSTNRSLGVGSKSNDKHFLCLGDSLVVVHQGNHNISNDPNLATPAGIGYGLYDCVPSISGLRIDDIRSDACFNRQSILLNNVPVAPALGFWMSFGMINGNVNFVNNGNIQRLFNNNRPKKLYFSTMTIDDFANRAYEGNSCTNANVRDMPVPLDTFSVVYLNKILEKDITYNYGTFNAQLTLTGGLPEYDNNAIYSISIKKASNNAILGNVTSGIASHNNPISITVPESGTYIILVTDGKSCDRTFSVHFPAIQLRVSTDTVSRQGDTACVKITARGFNNIISIENNFTYNHHLLRYVGVRNFNLPNLSAASFSNPAPAILTLSWNSNPPGVTRADHAVLFELCFQAQGSAGHFGAVRITDTINPIEVTYNNSDVNNRLMGVTVQNGGITVNNQALSIRVRTDSVICKGGLNGRIIAATSNGIAPYTYNWTGVNGANGNGTIPNRGDSLILNGLTAGNYSITLTDASNTRNIVTVVVGEPIAALYATLQTTQTDCFGNANGQMQLTTYGGGTDPYRFNWSNNATGTAINQLNAGNYTVTIIDARNCVHVLSDVIRVVTPVAIDSVRMQLKNPDCPKQETGRIVIPAKGGAGAPYTYRWSAGNVQTGAVFTNLLAGSYTFTVADRNGCSTIVSFLLVDPDSIHVRYSNVKSVSCANICNNNQGDGAITARAFGGTSMSSRYTYMWSSNETTTLSDTSRAIALCSGKQSLTIWDDQNTCVIVDTMFRITSDSLVISTTSTPSIVGSATGTASVSVTGGAPPYRYLWTRGDTVATIHNLASNTYTVTVTDANGCTRNKTISIITNGLQDDLAQKSVIQVFPNPVSTGELLNISVQWIHGMAQPIHITMRDAFGRLVEMVSETIVSDAEKTISLQHLPAGIYFLVFQSGDLRTVKSIIHTR
jgi:Secretion system C-terminal sorting domain/SprB repeat